MLRATVRCAPCNKVVGEVEGETLAELGQRIASTTLCAHATHPHVQHQHAAKISVPSALRASFRPIVFECLAPRDRCPAEKQRWEIVGPLEFVNAFAVLFHTGHEGHRFKFSYDGMEWSSPP